jgi:hypothetical protein
VSNSGHSNVGEALSEASAMWFPDNTARGDMDAGKQSSGDVKRGCFQEKPEKSGLLWFCFDGGRGKLKEAILMNPCAVPRHLPEMARRRGDMLGEVCSMSSLEGEKAWCWLAVKAEVM